jgi:hypothetical protein
MDYELEYWSASKMARVASKIPNGLPMMAHGLPTLTQVLKRHRCIPDRNDGHKIEHLLARSYGDYEPEYWTASKMARVALKIPNRLSMMSHVLPMLTQVPKRAPLRPGSQ